MAFDHRQFSADADGRGESGACSVGRGSQDGQDEESHFLPHEVELFAGDFGENLVEENKIKSTHTSNDGRVWRVSLDVFFFLWFCFHDLQYTYGAHGCPLLIFFCLKS